MLRSCTLDIKGARSQKDGKNKAKKDAMKGIQQEKSPSPRYNEVLILTF